MVSKDQFVKDMVDLQVKKRKKREDEIFAYYKQSHVSKKRNWNVKYGGYRW